MMAILAVNWISLFRKMNRETNTIGSKTQDMEATELVLQLKNEIEKIREQIQNIE